MKTEILAKFEIFAAMKSKFKLIANIYFRVVNV